MSTTTPTPTLARPDDETHRRINAATVAAVGRQRPALLARVIVSLSAERVRDVARAAGLVTGGDR